MKPNKWQYNVTFTDKMTSDQSQNLFIKKREKGGWETSRLGREKTGLITIHY